MNATNDGFIDHSAACQAQHEAWHGSNAPAQADTAERISKHYMYSSSDLKHMRKKGYSDEEILAFWDRDQSHGCEPVQHQPMVSYSGDAAEVMREVLRENLSPKAIATIAFHLRGENHPTGPATSEVAWFTEQLVEMFGGNDQYARLAEELNL